MSQDPKRLICFKHWKCWWGCLHPMISFLYRCCYKLHRGHVYSRTCSWHYHASAKYWLDERLALVYRSKAAGWERSWRCVWMCHWFSLWPGYHQSMEAVNGSHSLQPCWPHTNYGLVFFCDDLIRGCDEWAQILDQIIVLVTWGKSTGGI